MEDIKLLRARIDELDLNMVELFEERMEIVLKVAEYKKVNKLPILNEVREREVLEENKKRLHNKEFEESLEKFFIHLMNLSKDEQKKVEGE